MLELDGGIKAYFQFFLLHSAYCECQCITPYTDSANKNYILNFVCMQAVRHKFTFWNFKLCALHLRLEDEGYNMRASALWIWDAEALYFSRILVGYGTQKRYIFPYSTPTCVITFNTCRTRVVMINICLSCVQNKQAVFNQALDETPAGLDQLLDIRVSCPLAHLAFR